MSVFDMNCAENVVRLVSFPAVPSVVDMSCWVRGTVVFCEAVVKERKAEVFRAAFGVTGIFFDGAYLSKLID